MAPGLEHVRNLYEMCTMELLTMQNNADRFQENIKQFLRVIEEHWDDIDKNKAIASIAYDKFLSSLSNVMDMTRKYNLHMQLYYLERDSKQHFYDLERKQVNVTITEREFESQNNDCILSPTLSLESGVESPANSTFSNIDAKDVKCQYRKKDLSVYECGSVLLGFITYISASDTLRFFICDATTVDTRVLLNQDVVTYRQRTSLPCENEVFGLTLDGVVLRAVRCNPLNSSKNFMQTNTALLLDFGEVVEFSKNDIMYHLPKELKRKPAQALPCKLYTQADATDRDKLQQQLQGLLYQKCAFRVISIEDEMLQLQLQTEEEPHSKEVRCKTNTNPFLNDMNDVEEAIPFSALPHVTIESDENPPNGLTAEDLDMLYEEPICTSNAMKAVMGYNPKDDLRICRFYDPKLRGCFKGANCRQEHTSKQPDGWTKDVLPAASIIDNRTPMTVYTRGSIINITPTHVLQPDRFYAQISNTKETKTPNIWDTDDIPDHKRLDKLPLLFDIVLARYEDGFWYRAKAIETYEDSNMVKLFYVDYGNQQTVHLRELAACSYTIAKLPFQAVLFRLAGMRNADVTPEKRQEGINLLRGAILNKSCDVRVVSHFDDLVVQFLDVPLSYLPKNLIEMGCMKPFKA